MKTEWTSDELDLNKHLKPLTDFVDDNHKFIEEVFSIFSIQELKSLTPDILKVSIFYESKSIYFLQILMVFIQTSNIHTIFMI
jgi:hypothetical protein